MELKSYVCPNCGANTTNAQNCDYCGSFLVRFVEKGIDLSQTTYTSNSEVFPGLIEELKRNLKLQSENPSFTVATDLKKMRGNVSEGISIVSGLWWIGTKQRRLCICLRFDTYKNDAVTSFRVKNEEIETQFFKFQQLDSFPLFIAHNSQGYTDSMSMYRNGREYAINFGEDAEGAARLISEILIKVYGWSLAEPFDMFTNSGYKKIEHARRNWDVAHGIGKAGKSVDNSGCAGIIIALIVSITTLCSVFF